MMTILPRTPSRSRQRVLAAIVTGTATILLLGAGGSAGATDGPPTPTTSNPPSAKSPRERAAKPHDEHDRPSRRGFGQAFGGGGHGGDGERFRPSDVSDQAILEVIKDLDPDKYEAAKEKLTGGDAAARAEVRQTMMQRQRRLLSLAILRERNPELYETKKEEFRKQRDTRAAAEAYHRAKEAGDVEEMKRAEARIRESVISAVDLGLKAKSQELKALLNAADRMRAELQNETRNEARKQKVDSIVDEMISNPSPSPADGPPGHGARPDRPDRPMNGPGERPPPRSRD